MEPIELSHHHRNTLTKIFQHPASHNIDWHDVTSLLNSVGSVERHGADKMAVTVGSETALFDVPQHKDVDLDTVVELRRLLTAAGYGPE